MSLPPNFLEELRNRVSLAGVIGRRVKLTRKGKEHMGLCPFHNEKSPSFSVVEDKGFYHCFGCGAHGDVISFVMQSEGLTFPEAVEKLAGEAGMEVPKPSPRARAEEEVRKGLTDAVELACRFFQGELAAPGGAAGRRYLEGRGLKPDTIAAFRLGYAPGRRGALATALKGEGIDERLLVEAGLAKRGEGEGEESRRLREYFFDRVIFPIEDRRGRVVAFGGRTLGDGQPKYLNSPDSTLFHKGRLLYNLPRARQAVRDGQPLLVVEGYMDVIALAEAGVGGAVAPLGTAVTEDQILELWKISDEPIFCLDGDNAGRRAAIRAAERALPILEPGKTLRFVFLPDGEDPDSFVRRYGPAEFHRLLSASHSLSSFLWASIRARYPTREPEQRSQMLSEALSKAGLIKNHVISREYASFFKDQHFLAGRVFFDKNKLRPANQNNQLKILQAGRFDGRLHAIECIMFCVTLNPDLILTTIERLTAYRSHDPTTQELWEGFLSNVLNDDGVYSPERASQSLHDLFSHLVEKKHIKAKYRLPFKTSFGVLSNDVELFLNLLEIENMKEEEKMLFDRYVQNADAESFERLAMIRAQIGQLQMAEFVLEELRAAYEESETDTGPAPVHRYTLLRTLHLKKRKPASSTVKQAA